MTCEYLMRSPDRQEDDSHERIDHVEEDAECSDELR
jgi:hypothetical protein